MEPALSSSENPLWRIHLLGGLRVTSRDGKTTVTRFQTQATGALLAYLAFHSLKGVAVPREVAIDAIWPDVSPISARNRFKIALSSLRAQFAVPPFDKADIIVADMFNVALNSTVFASDVSAFEIALKRASRTPNPSERIALLDDAIDVYSGDLLVGRYDAWIESEQDRLRLRFEAASKERETLWQLQQSVSLSGPELSTTIKGTPKPTNVPFLQTRLFGRRGELAYLRDRLIDAKSAALAESISAPLLTLTGIGGIGKSRLATETAQRLLADFDQRVWFVELAEVTDPKQIWVQLRDTLGLSKQSEAAAPDQVLNFLSTSPTLLVLDNMEQFVASGHAVEFVNSLRSQLPSLSLLVTSRHVIGAYGEQILPVGSLLFPSDWAVSSDAQSEGGQLPIDSCVALFADRARAVVPTFQRSEDNESPVQRLCEVLDGIPLAIELAAARANFLTPGQLLSQVAQRFDWLKSSRKDIPARHRSLQAAVDTSYRLLSLELQQTFRALSIFRGGWTLDAASAVCEMETGELWDALIELNERSLVQSVGSEGEVRFRMLDTLRDFAAERLTEIGGEQAAVQGRHWKYFDRLAVVVEPHIAAGAADPQPWLDKIEFDHDNFRVAFASQACASDNLLMATRLHRFWYVRGYVLEGRQLVNSFLPAAIHVAKPERAKAHLAAGMLDWAAGTLENAQSNWTTALDLFRSESDDRAMAGVLNNLGIVSCQNGYLDQGRAYYIESSALYSSMNDTVHQSIVLTNLGGVLIYQEDFSAARTALSDALRLQVASGDQVTALRSLNSLAEVNIRLADLDAAGQAVAEGLRLRIELNDFSTLWEPLLTAAFVLSGRDKLKEATTIWGAVEEFRQAAGVATTEIERTTEQELHGRIAGTAFETDAIIIGRAMGVKRALTYARDALQKACASTDQ